MAYQIDFTASNYVVRSRRKACLRLALLAAAAGAAWTVHDVYVTYNEPTLNMRLAEYEAVARPIEEMNAAWDQAAKEYGAMMRYYRLVWAANATNVLAMMASDDAPRLGRGSHPVRWRLKTGGECRMDFRYAFKPGDKAEQVKGLEAEVAQAVTSRVQVAGGKVDVAGVRHENLLTVNGLDLSVRFALPDVRTFPAKEKTLADCVAEIAQLRKKAQEVKVEDTSRKGAPPKAVMGVMTSYIPIGRDKPGFPDMKDVIDIGGWFGRADQFIAHNRIPGSEEERRKAKAAWNDIGEARFPWQRYRALDNAAFAERTKALGTVSDGVKRFKGFLEKRHADCRKKLDPFVEAYEHGDVFNKPIVETDLKGRVAQAAGLDDARVTFCDEAGAEPAVLVKDDEKFSFMWVRWTLAVGAAAGRDGERARTAAADGDEEPITLAKLQDCIRRTMALGPGYALDAVRIDFGADGKVVGAVLEGLLPVKKVEQVSGGGEGKK